jgi:PEP-CTERM motif-containing protein
VLTQTPELVQSPQLKGFSPPIKHKKELLIFMIKGTLRHSFTAIAVTALLLSSANFAFAGQHRGLKRAARHAHHMARLGLAAPSAVTSTLGWNFGDDNATFDTGTTTNFTVSDFSIGNTLGTVSDPVNPTSPSGGYAGASGTGNIGNAAAIGAFDASTRAFYAVTFTPAAGFGIQLTNFDFGMRSTGTGPQAFSLRSSVDGFATEIVGGIVLNDSTWHFFDNSFTAFTGPQDTAVTFRLYTFGGAGSPASSVENNRMDDITIDVTAVVIPEPATSMLIGVGLLLVAQRFIRRKTS